ncbi:MAG: tetratricopeptide repeat protein [Candidatus Binatia bacterium]
MGLWTSLSPSVLLLVLLWLPGSVLARALVDTAMSGTRVAGDRTDIRDLLAGPGRFALECAVSLALLNAGLVPQLLWGQPLSEAALSLALVFIATAVFGLSRDESAGGPANAAWPRDRIAWMAAGLALLALLPAVVAHSGGSVDDWWDLAYVRSWIELGYFSASEPFFRSDFVHPRFVWNGWLMLQALVSDLTGIDSMDFQSGPLAVWVCLLAVSAVAMLAEAVLGREARSTRTAALLCTPLWLYGTESLPFFTRLYQDKFVAGLVLMPALLACCALYLRRPRPLVLLLVLSCAVATVSVHGLIYAVSLVGVGALFLAYLAGRRRSVLDRSLIALLLATGLPLLYPLWQGLTLGGIFDAQGIGVSQVDNPVVRAHWALGRLFWPDRWYSVVNPAAVFGPPALLLLPSTVLLWRDRRRIESATLLSLVLVPCVLIFVPGVSAAVGRLLVPWMLYRLGWLVPVPLLMALLFVPARRVVWDWRRVGSILVLALVSVGLSVPTAADRLRRGMRKHPYERSRRPEGHALSTFRYLASTPRRGPVLAPYGFSELLPAMSGRPVVAFSERGTVVFSRNEAEAYRRLADRAEFFSSRSSAERRAAIAERYGVSHAVFRRRFVPAGEAQDWLSLGTAKGFLLSRDWLPWSASRLALAEALPGGWTVVFENSEFFVVEIPDRVGGDRRGGQGARTISRRGSPSWLAPFKPVAAAIEGFPSGVVGSLVGGPPLAVELDPVPLSIGKTDIIGWTVGGSRWAERPSEVSMRLDLGAECEVTGIELVPFMRLNARQVLEVVAADSVGRHRAVHGHPIFLELSRAMRRAIRVEVRSLLGFPFALSDVRVLGDPESCHGSRRSDSGPRLTADLAPLLDLAREFPRTARSYLGVARELEARGLPDDALAVLRLGLQRDKGLANAWVEYGLLLDRQGRGDDAMDAWRNALRTDSNNAWARGCAAWARLRGGRLLGAWYHSRKAISLDGRYADAYTIQAGVQRRLGFSEAAEENLEKAILLDPYRAWPYQELYDLLITQSRYREGEELLIGMLERLPDDSGAVDKLNELRRGYAPRDGG